jgi:3-hydroxymyristoyl/3-hydroxydecanoyl-(acyl carrier protein) dehydratase
MRFLLLDRIDELKKGSYAVATKCVSLADDCFEHHFPGQPVYPGALMIEALAQLGGALLELTLRDERDYRPRCVMSGVKAKLREFVRPGDALALRAEIVSRHEDSALVRAVASRGEERVCEAELLYVFLRIDDARLERSREDYLDILTRATRVVA